MGIDVIDEEAISAKLVNPALDRLKNEIIPNAASELENAVRRALDGATITISLKPKP